MCVCVCVCVCPTQETLEAIVHRVPPPRNNIEAPLRALIFDSYYDPYRGVVCQFRVMDGSVSDTHTRTHTHTQARAHTHLMRTDMQGYGAGKLHVSTDRYRWRVCACVCMFVRVCRYPRVTR